MRVNFNFSSNTGGTREPRPTNQGPKSDGSETRQPRPTNQGPKSN